MENGFGRCKSCGWEITGTDKFCPNCGAKINGKRKKPLFKKWWFWVIVLVVIGIIAGGGKDDTSEPVSTNAPISVPTSAPVIEQTEAPKMPAVSTEPAADEESTSKAETVELLISILEMSVGENFDYCKIEGDETGITVSVANDGLCEAVYTAKNAGFDENFAEWVEMKNAMVGLCNTIIDSATQFGLDGIIITVNTLNDLNYDNSLLMVMNGVVVYDVMAD